MDRSFVEVLLNLWVREEGGQWPSCVAVEEPN